MQSVTEAYLFRFIWIYSSLSVQIKHPIENDSFGHVGGTETMCITVQQYNTLVQLVPEIEKLKETIKKMKELIELKDKQIHELKKKTTFPNLREVRTSRVS